MRWLDPVDLSELTGDYEAIGHVNRGDALSSQRRSAALRAEPPSGVSVLRMAATIAGALLVTAFLFLIIFGLPGLFAGV
jgi:hypothetical protein